MAKTSMIEREKRREKLAKRYAAKRATLKETIRDPKSSDEEREAAQRAL
jgi:small subunit ribosomal protein S14